MPPRGAAARGAAKATLAGVLHERICDERFGEAHRRARRATAASATSSARACARRGASAIAPCASPPRSCASSRWPSPRASRPGRWRAPKPTSRSSAIRSSASSRCGARRPTPSATRAASATTRCSTSTSPTCAWPGSSRCCTACATSSCRSCRRSPRGPGPTTRSCTAPIRTQTQRAVGARLAAAIGFDFEAGRLDEAAHPFASGFAPGDVRLTTREQRGRPLRRALRRPARGGARPLRAGPHGRRSRARSAATPPRSGCTSRSRASGRTWSAARARSGSGTWREVREAFPEQLNDVSLEQFVRAANLVEPSLIRVEADEVTYHLHVFLRFELELALVRGDLAVDDLPAAWNERMRTLVGIEPPDDGVGVLQDVHWSAGLIGYFPTYTLGTLYSAQFLEAIERELGPIDAIVRAGRVRPPARLAARARAQPRRARRARADRARRDRRGARPRRVHALPARQVRRAVRARLRRLRPRASGWARSCTARPSSSSRSRCASASASAKRCSWKPSVPPHTMLGDVVGAAGALAQGLLVLVEPHGVVHRDLLRARRGPLDHAAVARDRRRPARAPRCARASRR